LEFPGEFLKKKLIALFIFNHFFLDHSNHIHFRSARTMLANRISFALGIHGPSLALDTACSSSMYALDYAYKSILSGECDAAIVGGANLLLQPYLTVQFARFV
jgi:acyl transferase domain-containing protein